MSSLNSDINYEKKDSNVRLIVISGIVLMTFSLIVALLMIPLFKVLNTTFLESYPSPSYIGKKEVQSPATLLEPHPSMDIHIYEEEMAERINHYGWVDREKGIVHIPIDAAIHKYVENKEKQS